MAAKWPWAFHLVNGSGISQEGRGRRKREGSRASLYRRDISYIVTDKVIHLTNGRQWRGRGALGK